MRIFLTGAAGFIGHAAARTLLARGHEIVGSDDLNPYYDPALKRARLATLESEKGFRFVQADISDMAALQAAAQGSFDAVLHLAAQASVRYALKNPAAYTRSNLIGKQNILELARAMKGLGHLIYASSSSVYGNDEQVPYIETARADHPISYYGATKRAGELFSHAYSELFGLKQTGLRFFTVYGPWGRPDMAYWMFTEAVLKGEPVKLFGGGRLRRDFTYVDDITDALARIVETPFKGEGTPHRLYNLGNSRPEETLTLLREVERATGKTAIVENVDTPLGEVRETFADITRAQRDFGFSPSTKLSEGIPRFVQWYREFYNI
jgi:UDP-glucuronate 4-epimerase